MENKRFVLMDGGHDTELRLLVGNEFDDHPLWICRYLVEKPDLLQRVYQLYIQAGAETIFTNTYQATVDGFKKYLGFSKEESVKMIKNSVTMVQEAIRKEQENGLTRHVAVVGTVGPYGAYLHDGSEYAGGFYADHMSKEELIEWHRSRVEALLEGGVDYLFCGTIPSLKEAEAILTLLKEKPGVKTVMSFSAQDPARISHGELFVEVAQQLWDNWSDQLVAVGVNCLHPRLALALLSSVRQLAPHIPLCVKPNTHEIFNTNTRQWEESSDDMTLAHYCDKWLEMGIEYISGCCRTSSKDIQTFRHKIDKFTLKAR